MIDLVICSPQPALRAGLRALLSADPDFRVSAAAPGLASLPDLAPEMRVLVATPGGLNLPGDLESHPDIAVLLVTDDWMEIQFLAESGERAWGVLSPEAPAETLQAAVRALAEGLSAASPDVFQRLMAQPRPAPSLLQPGEEPHADPQAGAEPGDRLTTREIEVLGCMALGLTNKQIALTLKISEHTVKFHVSSIYSRLGAANRTEAVRIGARRGLVPL